MAVRTIAFPISVGPTGRYLVDANGVPFIQVADSAWGLEFVSLALATTYLEDRQAKGYNTILIAPPSGSYISGTSNPGMLTNDGLQPFGTPGVLSTVGQGASAAYWTRIDQLVSLITSFGFYIQWFPANTGDFLRAAGSGVGTTSSPDTGAPILLNAGQAGCYAYGQWLGTRYKGFNNIMWAGGNDFDGDTWAVLSNDQCVLAVNQGILSQSSNQLHTAEFGARSGSTPPNSFGNSASTDDNRWWKSNGGVISINSLYCYCPAYTLAKQTWQNTALPVMPAVMAETFYEAPGATYTPNPNSYLMRGMGWTGIIYGCLGGMFYGDNGVYPFGSVWQSRLSDPGSTHCGYIAQFMAGIPWWKLIPDHSNVFVTAGLGTQVTDVLTQTTAWLGWVTAAISVDGAIAVVYCPFNTTITVNMALFAGPVTAVWYDPTNNTYTPVSGTQPFANTGTKTFTSVNNALGDPDMVLLFTANLQPQVQTSWTADASGQWSSIILALGPAPGSAIAEIQENSVALNQVQQLSVPYKSIQLAGDLNIVTVIHAGVVPISGVTDLMGNIYQLATGPTPNGTGRSQSVYFCSNIVAANAGQNAVSVAFAASEAFVYILISEWEGIPNAVVDVANTAIGNSATPTAGITPTAAGELVYAATGMSYGQPSPTFSAGETNVLGGTDGSNANNVFYQSATLSQVGTLISLSFDVQAAAGSLVLGIYSDNAGKPGNLLASTAAFVPVVGWNTQNVTTQIVLQPGNYWLAYCPSDNGLGFFIGSGGTYVGQSFTYTGSLPATFGTQTATGGFHWSFYATLFPAATMTPGAPFQGVNTPLSYNGEDSFEVTAAATAVVASFTANFSAPWTMHVMAFKPGGTAISLRGTLQGSATSTGKLIETNRIAGTGTAKAKSTALLSAAMLKANCTIRESVVPIKLSMTNALRVIARANGVGSGVLSTSIALAGICRASVVISANLKLTALSGLCVAKAQNSGTVIVKKVLSGTCLMKAESSGTIAKFQGVCTVRSSNTGTVTVRRPLAGSAQAQSVSSGGLAATKPLQGIVIARANVFGRLSESNRLTSILTARARSRGTMPLQLPIPANVGKNSAIFSAAITTTIPLNWIQQAGDLLILGIAQSSSDTVTSVVDPVNGTWLQALNGYESSGNGINEWVYYVPSAKAAPAGTVVTITHLGTGGFYYYLASEWTNPAPVSVVDGAAFASGGGANGVGPSVGPIVTTNPNDIIYSIAFIFGGVPLTPGAGFTGLNAPAVNAQDEVEVVATTGSYTGSFSIGPNFFGGWKTAIVAFKGAPIVATLAGTCTGQAASSGKLGAKKLLSGFSRFLYQSLGTMTRGAGPFGGTLAGTCTARLAGVSTLARTGGTTGGVLTGTATARSACSGVLRAAKPLACVCKALGAVTGVLTRGAGPFGGTLVSAGLVHAANSGALTRGAGPFGGTLAGVCTINARISAFLSNGRITGVCQAKANSTGTLTRGSGPFGGTLAGTCRAKANHRGTLSTPQVALVSTGLVHAANTGVLRATKPLVGIADARAVITGTLTRQSGAFGGTLAGTCTVKMNSRGTMFTVLGTGILVGGCLARTTSSGFLRASKPLAAKCIIQANSSGNLPVILSGVTYFCSNLLLNYLLRGVAGSFPSTVYVGLLTARPTDAGGGTVVELTTAQAAGYQRQGIAVSPFNWTTLLNGSTSNVGPIAFGTPGAGSSAVVTNWGIFDSLSGGSLLIWGDLIPKVLVTVGSPYAFQSGSLVIRGV